jgi:hypothetical protein
VQLMCLVTEQQVAAPAVQFLHTQCKKNTQLDSSAACHRSEMCLPL